MNIDTIEDIVGWIACGLTISYFIPQIIPYIHVIQGNLYFEDTPGFFISTCYINSYLWYIYGEMIYSDQIRISNIIACFICLISMGIYIIYEIRKYTIDAILNILIIIMASWAAYKYLIIVVDDDRVIGKLCIGSSIILYLYFIYIINKVIKEKNFLLIQFYHTLIYLLVTISWIAYGIITKDVYIVFPYSLGIIFSLIEIVIYLTYKKKYPFIEEKDFSSTIGIESNVNEDNKREKSINIEDDKAINNIKERQVKIVSKIHK
jgi:hypothetical protein